MALLRPRHNQTMRFLLAVIVCVVTGVGLGLGRGPTGWEMLSPQERFWVFLAICIVWLVSRLLLHTKRSWIPAAAAVALFMLLAIAAGRIFEPRFHMNFNGNGVLCMARSMPAALLSALCAVVIVRPRRAVAIGLLGASAAVIAQTLYCTVVESRHIAEFHVGQLLFWPAVVSLMVYSLRPRLG